MAKLDPLLAALINKLPLGGKPWPAADRTAWLDMMTKAFDVVYGVETSHFASFANVVGKASTLPEALIHRRLYGTFEEPSDAAPPAPPARGFKHDGHNFYVSADGTVCNADATPVMMIDVPPEETIFDYRPVTGEFRDLDSIVWADGARGRAGLAAGVSFCGPG